ncbi:MAG: hypothetical protein GY927_20280, partial [bacterium]|nr:hypothetical protein [bacterium]
MRQVKQIGAAISASQGMNPLAHFTKAVGLFLAQRASYLSSAVYRRTETAVHTAGNTTMTEIIYRRNAVLETLRANRRHIERLWMQKGLDKKLARPFFNAAQTHNIPVQMADKQKLGHLAQDSKHQGVVLETGAYPYSSIDNMLALARGKGERPFLLLLDLLHGPQNIGALLRTAEICGVH